MSTVTSTGAPLTARSVLMLVWLLSFNTQSITGTRYWSIELTMLARNILFAFVIVAHGVFISWFRTLGLVIYVAYLFALVWLEQKMGVSGVYSIFRFFNNEYNGQQLILDWPAIITQVIAAAVLLGVSYRLWTKRESQPAAAKSSRFSKLLPALFSTIAFVVLALTLVALVVNSIKSTGHDTIVKMSTQHYRFAYKQSDQSRMAELARYADSDYEMLTEMLAVENLPKIQADMTSQSTHALGVAAYNKIRMVLSERESVSPVYRRVLSHETTHVLQTIESNRRLGLASNSVGFFVEGMAQYTSFTLAPDQETRDTNWAISSVAWKRHNISFDALANRAAFEARYDPELLYGIGDIWVAAMASVCGESSLGNFLRAIGQPDAAKGLSGTSFWRHHLNQIDCGLESINHRWREMMQGVIDSGNDGAFPEFQNVSISTRDDSLLVRAQAKHNGEPRPSQYYIRLASETQLARTVSPIRNGRYTDADDITDIEFTVPLSEIGGRRFRYQIGYSPFPDSRYYFDKWRSGAVP